MSNTTVQSLSAKRRSRAKGPGERRRAQYIPEACTTCKKKKVRCNGKIPCDVCRKHSVDCHYPAASGLQSRYTYQQAPDTECGPIYGKSGAMQTDGMQSKSPSLPDFNGPTSSDFSFSIARMILEQGRDGPTEPESRNTEIAGSITTLEEEDYQTPEDHSMMINIGPLHTINSSEALRLIDVYNEVVGILHPIVDIELMKRQAEAFCSSSSQVEFSTEDDDINQLKMVIAIALLAEGGGYNSIAVQIHESLHLVVSEQILSNKFTLQGHVLLLLTGIFHTFEDNCRLASRIIAIAARMIIEAGLHRKQVLIHRFPDNNERKKIVTALYTSMILDRQLNFAAGLPFTLKDTDIDIPEVEDMPYMKAMVSYVRFGAQAWSSVTDGRGGIKPNPNNDTFDYLEYQVRCWQESLPIELRPHQCLSNKEMDNPLDSKTDQATFSRRSILYLRANQIKTIVSRPLLFSLQSLNANLRQVAIVTDIALDTINKVIEIDKQSDLYQKQQPIVNHFLSSALSTLFLVFVHYSKHGQHINITEKSPNITTVLGGITKALHLLHSYSSCRSSQRLWNKFAGPKGLLSYLGLSQGIDQDPTAIVNCLKLSPSTGTTLSHAQDPSESNVFHSESVRPIGNGVPSSSTYIAAEYPVNQTGSGFTQYTGIMDELWPLGYPEIGQILAGNDFDMFFDDML
ncbi:hypothetical protein B7463_g5421, partial [Scytalidium lignicola]